MTSLRTIRGFAFDLDGTIWAGPRLLPGAAEIVAAMRAAGLAVVFASNSSRQGSAALARELTRLGVQDYGFDRCWRDYRRLAVHGVLMGVFSAMAVERTERGDALFLAMTRGACLQALDHGTFDLWDEAA